MRERSNPYTYGPDRLDRHTGVYVSMSAARKGLSTEQFTEVSRET